MVTLHSGLFDPSRSISFPNEKTTKSNWVICTKFCVWRTRVRMSWWLGWVFGDVYNEVTYTVDAERLSVTVAVPWIPRFPYIIGIETFPYYYHCRHRLIPSYYIRTRFQPFGWFCRFCSSGLPAGVSLFKLDALLPLVWYSDITGKGTRSITSRVSDVSFKLSSERRCQALLYRETAIIIVTRRGGNEGRWVWKRMLKSYFEGNVTGGSGLRKK